MHIPAVGLELKDGFEVVERGCAWGSGDLGNDGHAVLLVGTERLCVTLPSGGSGANDNVR